MELLHMTTSCSISTINLNKQGKLMLQCTVPKYLSYMWEIHLLDFRPVLPVFPLLYYHITINIYLFIYCHSYRAFSIVQCSNALYRLWNGEIQSNTGQTSVWEINAHTMYNQWATAPGRSLNYPRPKSITHLCTFCDNGVYAALQLFLVILVSDQWRRVLIPYSYRQVPWSLLHARGWLSRYT